MLNDLKEKLLDYDKFVVWYSNSPYNNTNIVNCQPWQLREALSFYITNPQITANIKSVIDSFETGQSFDYSKLTVIEEATIQYLLRLKGYEFIGVDEWPTNTIALADISHKVAATRLLKYQIFDRPLRFYSSINFQSLKDYAHAIVYLIAAIIFFNPSLLVYSLIIGYCLWMVADVVRHDYIEHQYLTPKNSIIKYLIDGFIYLTVPATYHDRENLVETHQQHHRFWKTEKDKFTMRVKNELIPGLKEYDLSLIKKPAVNEGKFKYFVEVKLAVLIVLAVLYGITNVLFLILLPLALINVLSFQHDWYFFKFGERNYAYLFPLTLNQSWHLEHHKTFKHQPKNWGHIFKGPNWSRYLNPQYYIVRLLFNLNSSIAR